MTDVLVYMRTSTKDQNIGLEKQRNKIADYCVENKYNIVKTYEEQISGKTSLITPFQEPDVGASIMNNCKREALHEALNKVKFEDIDKVIVYNPSRLARKMHYQGMLEEVFEKCGAPIEYVEVSGDWLEKTMKSVINEYEVKQTVQRINDSLEQKQQNDEVLGRPPTGFKTVEDHNKFEPEDWLQDLIDAVEAYQDLDGASRAGIANNMYATNDEVTEHRIRSLQKNIEEDKPASKYVKGKRPY